MPREDLTSISCDHFSTSLYIIKTSDAVSEETQITEMKQSVHGVLSFYVNTLSEVTLQVWHAVAQLVEALRYKFEGRGFSSPWCQWIFSLT
jgi:hypothetical protein